MKKPFFSVIIPTLNEEKYLPRLINNLENQINKNFETIIIDGKSTDATKKIIFKHKKFFNFKFIKNSWLGLRCGGSWRCGFFTLFHLPISNGKNYTEDQNDK